jgi:hypothetical protein
MYCPESVYFEVSPLPDDLSSGRLSENFPSNQTGMKKCPDVREENKIWQTLVQVHVSTGVLNFNL